MLTTFLSRIPAYVAEGAKNLQGKDLGVIQDYALDVIAKEADADWSAGAYAYASQTLLDALCRALEEGEGALDSPKG
jgi:hypothetical protein